MSSTAELRSLTEEHLSVKHKKEKKELQGMIMQLKKSVNKDKKKKKEISDQIDNLEQDLIQKHKQEVEEWNSIHEQPEDVEEQMEKLLIEDSRVEEMVQPLNMSQSKVTKAEKRRQKKAADNRKREDAMKAMEKDSKGSSRTIEIGKLKRILKDRGLDIYEIRSDGDCLFAAIAHQLHDQSNATSLRKLAADSMSESPDDFLPFLGTEDGNMMNEEQFTEYCHKIKTTSLWGGSHEAEGSPLIFGKDFPGTTIVLPFHRHFCGLGEHYNSVTKKEADS